MGGSQVAVAAPSELAAQAAVAVAAAGGNAVDAAVAATFVTLVNEPGIVSLGGSAFATVAGVVGGSGPESPVTVDGNVSVPAAAAAADGQFSGDPASGRGMWPVTIAYGDGVNAFVGPGSVALPGALAALGQTHQRWGELPWSDVLQPAVLAARDGFRLSSASAHYLPLAQDVVYGWDGHSRELLAATGAATGFRVGELVTNGALAETLHHLQRVGPQDLYTGELAGLLLAAQAANEGFITAADLAGYEAVCRDSLVIDWESWQVATNPAPAVGGVRLAALLQARAELGQHEPGLAETAQENGASGGDAAAWVAAQQRVLSADRVAAGRSPSTVHVSAIDDQGLACAITASHGYGSGATIPGTGMWLNNCLGEPELNADGLLQGPAGRRVPSNMAPSVAWQAAGDRMALGSPGADRITTALAQCLWAMSQGTSTVDAVAAPRVHVVADGDDGWTAYHEPGMNLPASVPTLAWSGLDMYFGGVTIASRSADGRLTAVADPRRDGGVVVTP